MSAADQAAALQKRVGELIARINERAGRKPNPQRPLAEPLHALSRTPQLATLAPSTRRAAVSAAAGAVAASRTGAMVPDPSEADVALAGCAALAALGGGAPEHKAAVAAHGGVAAIVAAMRQHDVNARVLEAACAALARLVIGCPDAADVVRMRGGVAAIVAVLRNPRTCADVDAAREACGALCNVAVNNPALKTLAARDGAVAAIVRAMDVHATEPTVLRNACAALWNLAAKNEENKALIVKENGLARIVGAMRAYPQDAAIANFACAALWNVAASDARRKDVVNAGAVPVICDALELHRRDAGVQYRGCGALRNLALDAANAVEIAQRGGVLSAASALGEHAASADVQVCCLEALSTLAASSDVNKRLPQMPNTAYEELVKANPPSAAAVFSLVTRSLPAREVESVVAEIEAARSAGGGGGSTAPGTVATDGQSPALEVTDLLGAFLATTSGFRDKTGRAVHESSDASDLEKLRELERACEAFQVAQDRVAKAATATTDLTAADMQEHIKQRNAARAALVDAADKFASAPESKPPEEVDESSLITLAGMLAKAASNLREADAAIKARRAKAKAAAAAAAAATTPKSKKGASSSSSSGVFRGHGHSQGSTSSGKKRGSEEAVGASSEGGRGGTTDSGDFNDSALDEEDFLCFATEAEIIDEIGEVVRTITAWKENRGSVRCSARDDFEKVAQDLAARLRLCADLISGKASGDSAKMLQGLPVEALMFQARDAAAKLVKQEAKKSSTAQARAAQEAAAVPYSRQATACVAAERILVSQIEKKHRIAKLRKLYAETLPAWRALAQGRSGNGEGSATEEDDTAQTLRDVQDDIEGSSCLVSELEAKRRRLMAQRKAEEAAMVQRELADLRERLPHMAAELDKKVARARVASSTHWPEKQTLLVAALSVVSPISKALSLAAREDAMSIKIEMFGERKHVSDSTLLGTLGDTRFALRRTLVPTPERASTVGFLYRALSRLANPSILRPSGFFVDEGDAAAYFVYPFCVNGNLRTKGPGSAPAVFALKLIESVHFLHSHGIVHGRIRPENVLVSETGEALLDGVDWQCMLGDPHLQLLHPPLRTGPFAAPELSAQDAIAASFASDVFSLGKLLAEFVAASVPDLVPIAAKMVDADPLARPSLLSVLQGFHSGAGSESVLIGPLPMHWDFVLTRSTIAPLADAASVPSILPSRLVEVSGRDAAEVQRAAGTGVPVSRVERVENSMLWAEYVEKRCQYRALQRMLQPLTRAANEETTWGSRAGICWLDMSSGVHECLLFVPCTDRAQAVSLAQHGLLSKRPGQLGFAFYFSPNLKNVIRDDDDEDDDDDDDEEPNPQAAVVFRVLAGDIFRASAPAPWLMRGPCRQGCAPTAGCSHARYNSCQLGHGQFAVYDAAQCFPEFVVTLSADARPQIQRGGKVLLSPQRRKKKRKPHFGASSVCVWLIVEVLA